MRESRRRDQPRGFRCGEAVDRDDGVASVVFRCNLPHPLDAEFRLEFRCREPSCGALEGGEEAAEMADEDYAVDPNFFDGGYSMAGSTGFKVWTGSRLLVEALAWPLDDDCKRLREIQRRIRDGSRCIELGAGVGVVGTYLAAMGSQVLLTDLPTLVANAVDGNIVRNGGIAASAAESSSSPHKNACPPWLAPDSTWIGEGWANSVPLDWTFPLEEQLTREQRSSIDFVVASDVVFLASMLSSLLNTVGSLFEASLANDPSFILSFQRRDAKDGEESVAFTTVNGVIAAVEGRGWSADCLAWRTVTTKKEVGSGAVAADEADVFVFEIKPLSLGAHPTCLRSFNG